MPITEQRMDTILHWSICMNGRFFYYEWTTIKAFLEFGRKQDLFDFLFPAIKFTSTTLFWSSHLSVPQLLNATFPSLLAFFSFIASQPTLTAQSPLHRVLLLRILFFWSSPLLIRWDEENKNREIASLGAFTTNPNLFIQHFRGSIQKSCFILSAFNEQQLEYSFHS